MNDLRELVADLRVSYTLVPWRMRPKIIAILLGSVLVAMMDMVAVVLTLPMMQIVSGTAVQDSPALTLIADLLGTQSTKSILIAVLLGVVFLMLLKNVFTILFRWWSLGVMADATADASYTMMSLYTSSPWVHHRRRRRENIYQAMTGYVPASFSATSDAIMLVVDVVAAAAVLGALVIVSPVATAVAILFFGGTALILQAVLRRGQLSLGRRTQQANVRSWSQLGPAIDGFKEARLANASDQFSAAYAETRRDAAFAQRALGVLNELPRYVLEIIMILGILVVAGVLFLTSSTQEALTFLGVFAVAAVRTVPALNRAVSTLGRIRSNIPNVRALASEVEELRSESGRAQKQITDHRFPSADILFTDVTFRFPDSDKPVLDQVSGIIPRGHTVALVGASGAGKTTFVDMLLALYEPESGSITVDGESIHDHAVSWREQLGVVSQDVYILGRSVRDNITFGVDAGDVDEDRLQRAVAMAQLTDTISEMPEGLDTVLGENGARVSGGQKQRIGIARALYRRPQVLVLDEATSALDNETEARITETIKSLRGQLTIVIVAHRLSTVKHADQILFFSRGKIADRGTMQELTERNTEFAELVRLGQLN